MTGLDARGVSRWVGVPHSSSLPSPETPLWFQVLLPWGPSQVLLAMLFFAGALLRDSTTQELQGLIPLIDASAHK